MNFPGQPVSATGIHQLWKKTIREVERMRQCSTRRPQCCGTRQCNKVPSAKNLNHNVSPQHELNNDVTVRDLGH